MALATVTINPQIYSRPPINPMPGARVLCYSMTPTAAQMTATNGLVLGVIPAQCRLMDAKVEIADIDTGTAVTWALGILNSYYNEAIAGTTGFRFKAGVAQAAAAYNSGGATNTNTIPERVTGQDLFDAGQTTGQSAGMVRMTNAAGRLIGIEDSLDRLVVLEFGGTLTGVQSGAIYLYLTVDQDIA
jgi:hypothetical protein